MVGERPNIQREGGRERQEERQTDRQREKHSDRLRLVTYEELVA